MTKALVQFLAGALVIFSGGCSSSGQTDYPKYFELIRQNFSVALGKSSVTLKQASAIPYASMGWRLNKGPQNLIILASDAGQELMWTSAARIVIVTQDGRIKRTAGLPRNISGLAPVFGNALTAPSAALKGKSDGQYFYDFPDIGAFGVQVSCKSQVIGSRLIPILGQSISTVRVEERCSCPMLKWEFTNIYWIKADTGFVWRTHQNLHPKGDTLDTEIFRPPE